MSLNGIRPIGDDQNWKAEVEKELKELKKLVAVLTQNARN